MGVTTLVLVVGVAGVGKSTIGNEVAKRTKSVLIDKDVLTENFTEVLLSSLSPNRDRNDRQSGFYLENVRPLEYEATLNVAEENLKLGNNVVIVAPFISELRKDNWLKEEMTRRNLKCNVKVIYVNASLDTQQKRLKKRNLSRDEWKLNNWSKYADNSDVNITWPLNQDELLIVNNDFRYGSPEYKNLMNELISWINLK